MGKAGQIRAEVTGGLGRITLDRPKALNALSLDMIEALSQQLDAWRHDASVHAISIEGAGSKAFCAGGDIRAVSVDAKRAERGKSDGTLSREFFRREYQTNLQIARYEKPIVSLIDGIAMGGGLGISVHGSHRIVTEHAELAMPETGIGFFPDVGATYFLSRCPGELGMYLALTGSTIRASDALYAGLATHFVAHETLPELLDALAESDWDGPAEEAVNDVLVRMEVTAGEAPLSRHRKLLDACFSAEDVRSTFRALAKAGDEWADATLLVLAKRSPTSLSITHHAIRNAAKLELEEALRVEYRLSQAMLSVRDFHEGVRAALIDKDKKPVWKPRSVPEVPKEEVEACFAPKAGETRWEPARG